MSYGCPVTRVGRVLDWCTLTLGVAAAVTVWWGRLGGASYAAIVASTIAPFTLLAGLVALAVRPCHRSLLRGAVAALCLLPAAWLLSNVASADPPAGSAISVGALNTHGGSASAAVVADLASDLDVVVLSEVTSDELPPFDAALEPAFRRVWRSHDPVRQAEVVAYVREGLEVGRTTTIPTPAPFGWLTLEVDGRPVHVIGGRLTNPVLQGLDDWDEGLDVLARRVNGIPEEEPVVLLGDLNATAWHGRFRQFTDEADLSRCADDAGSGLVATWSPTADPKVPLLAIDHVLVRGGACTRFDAVTVPGTDHSMVLGTVTLTAD